MNGTSGAFGSHQVANADMQDSTPSQAQPVQPAQSSSIFNFATTQPASSTTNGFSFGQSTAQQQNGGFGGGLFGQQNTQNQNTNTGLFGQSSNTQQNGFTPSFGQTKPDAAPSIFSQSTTSAAPSFGGFGSNTSSAPASTPSFSFGQSSVNQPTQPQPSESVDEPKKLFGFGASQSESSSAPTKPAFSFGQPAAASTQSDATPKPAFAGFGQSTTQQSTGASAPSIFSGFGSKPNEPSTSQQSSNLFGRAPQTQDKKETTEEPTSDESPQVPKNPFSSLFGRTSAKSETPETTKPAKTPFQFGQSTSFTPATSQSQPSQPISQSPDPSTTNKESMDQPKGFGFDRPTTSSQPKAAASTPFSGLFNLNKPTAAAQEEPASGSNQTTSTSSKSVFNFAPQKPVEPSSTPSSNLFNFGNKSASSAASEKPPSTEEGSPPKKRLFQGSSTPDAMAKSALGSSSGQVPASTTAPAAKERAHPQLKTSQLTSTTQESTNRAVSTEGPPSIPRFLSGEKYKVYDEVWRLKALNRRFKDTITSLDPEHQDFINIVQNYLDHREAIGEGLAGYERKKLAGTKRKAVDVDDLQDEEEQNKRTKPANTSSTFNQPISTIPSPPKPTSSSTSNTFYSSVTTQPPTSFTPVKTVADTQASNIFKSMIPGAASSTAPTSSAPSFVPMKSTTPPSSPPKAAAPQLPKFEVPKFGGAGNSFMNAFAKNSAANAKKFEQEAKEKRKAEEFDSDEDDEEEWNRKYEEEQRAKKAKIEAAARGALAVPTFIPSASSSRSNSPFTFGQPIKSIETNGSKSPEPSSLFGAGSSKSNAIEVESGEDTSGQESGNSGDDEADNAEEDEQQDQNNQEDDDEDDEDAEPIPDLPANQSLFGRITAKTPASNGPILQPAANNSFKPGLMFGNIGHSTPEQPTFSPITPATSGPVPKGDFVPTTKFEFKPVPATSTVFGLGGALKEGPIPGEGLFGSRPSTPNPDSSKPSTGFSFGSSTSKLPADNTYKQGTPIKFGASTNDSAAPSLEVTAATPPAKENPKPFAGLFGQSTANNASTNATSTGFSFGAPSSSQPAPGFLSAASHLGGTSGASSRATSPGVVSEAESVATDNTEDYSQEPQTSLMSSNNGEENEDVIFDAKAIISRVFKEDELAANPKRTKGWNNMGTGIMKLLKDKTSGKTRIVFRAEPGANVILNTRLIPGGAYKALPVGKTGGAITFPVATDEGMQSWMIRVKTLESAEQASKAMEENTKN